MIWRSRRPLATFANLFVRTIAKCVCLELIRVVWRTEPFESIRIYLNLFGIHSTKRIRESFSSSEIAGSRLGRELEQLPKISVTPNSPPVSRNASHSALNSSRHLFGQCSLQPNWTDYLHSLKCVHLAGEPLRVSIGIRKNFPISDCAAVLPAVRPALLSVFGCSESEVRMFS